MIRTTTPSYAPYSFPLLPRMKNAPTLNESGEPELRWARCNLCETIYHSQPLQPDPPPLQREGGVGEKVDQLSGPATYEICYELAVVVAAAAV